ncbi:MAG TPA: Kdo hydroxylase family protein [Terriglobales bacterium]|nr:Kdo hydroxylase family protein [Terriglobales bacterium]
MATSTGWTEITDFGPQGWAPQTDAVFRSRQCCEQLEKGDILFFSRPPFPLAEEDRAFLISQRHMDSRLHKNISYRPGENVLRGFSDSQESENRIHQIMRAYSGAVSGFVSRFLSPYAGKFQLDYASFRPLEEQGRDLPLHKRNDLLHVDAFPSRPTRGGRILRVFTNINPGQERIWLVGQRFPALAQHYALPAGLTGICHARSSLRARLVHLLHAARLPVTQRSPYDEFMLHFHDWLKENTQFQSGADKTRLAFPSLATWLVFTDGVPHAALSGQFALEQTFIIPPGALAAPDFAPIRILEKLCGRPLA